MQQPYIYLRALRLADHTVFCVQDGQKTYYDQRFERYVPYSSGQQVKRSMLDTISQALSEPRAPIEFVYQVKDDKSVGEGEAWQPCDPSYSDQLLGGWMTAESRKLPKGRSSKEKEQGVTEDRNDAKALWKRRSPLSISAMRVIHPLLGTVTLENITFDRSSSPGKQVVRVRGSNGNLLSDEEIQTFIEEIQKPLPPRKFIPKQKRASGLFIYDVAVDLRRLFSISLVPYEPEISKDIGEKLRAGGWRKSTNVFGDCLVCPEKRRKEIIPALAHGLIDWRITSNQARTFSLMETLAVAISDNANKVASAIRARLREDSSPDKLKAEPVLDDTSGADIHVTPCAEGYIAGASGTATALDDAERKLRDLLLAFDYENQQIGKK